MDMNNSIVASIMFALLAATFSVCRAEAPRTCRLAKYIGDKDVLVGYTRDNHLITLESKRRLVVYCYSQFLGPGTKDSEIDEWIKKGPGDNWDLKKCLDDLGRNPADFYGVTLFNP